MSGSLVKIIGRAIAKDKDTGEILLDKKNAIHPRNMAVVLARGLANETESGSTIYFMGLGNGGSVVTATDVVEYNAPFDYDYTSTARLYNMTYGEVVDDELTTGSSAGNSVTFSDTMDGDTAIVTVTLELGPGEPDGQVSVDTPPDDVELPLANDEFAFDEFGLFAIPAAEYGDVDPYDPDGLPSSALMLSHLIFSPILKTANRSIVITYTLSISVVSD